MDAEQLRAICASTLDLGNIQWPQGILPGLQLLFRKDLKWQQMPALKVVNVDFKAGSELRLTGLNAYRVHVCLRLSSVYVNGGTEEDSLPYFFSKEKAVYKCNQWIIMAFAFTFLKHEKTSKEQRQTDSWIPLKVNETEAPAICAFRKSPSLDRSSLRISAEIGVHLAEMFCSRWGFWFTSRGELSSDEWKSYQAELSFCTFPSASCFSQRSGWTAGLPSPVPISDLQISANWHHFYLLLNARKSCRCLEIPTHAVYILGSNLRADKL